jgi:hypothetical protein
MTTGRINQVTRQTVLAFGTKRESIKFVSQTVIAYNRH